MKKREKIYGIVEGFFSEPLPIWSEAERQETIDFVAKKAKEITTYVYCPKDDLLVTDKYDELYPKAGLEAIKNVIDQCNTNGINYVYGLNPAVENIENKQEIKKKIINKLEQLFSVGCRSFMILFDDIPLAYDVVAGTETESNFDKVIGVVNDVYVGMKEKIDEFWFCGPDYCYNRITPITKATKKLDKSIGVIWSGNQIFTKKVSLKDIARVKNILGQKTKIIYWDNYPVNDCEQAKGTFNLGGFYPIEKEVLKLLDGVIVNPMRECMANLPFYVTFSNSIKNDTYVRTISYFKAMTEVLGLNSGFVKSVLKFSSKNIVDTKVQIYGVLDTDPGTPNVYGSCFVKSIGSLVDDMVVWNDLYSEIEAGALVKESSFEKIDWFPTKTYIPRYLWEIFRIVNKRRSLYKDLTVEVPGLVGQFMEKYLGSMRLKISEEDAGLYLQEIQRLVGEERRDFVEYINQPKLSLGVKIDSLIRRRGVNRFTIN